MAKDDYYVIVAKLLTFLYRKLKGKENRSVLEYISNNREFPITPEYKEYVIWHMHKAGLIERVYCLADNDGEPLEVELTEETRITPEGIAYLEENSMVRKAIRSIPALASIAGGLG
ncbi:MAG: hypothetical protein J6O73_07875 [Lachnospiraceae bacterium]|nr:hypothetical protein [Lachnospiraceae bacterium]